ncbi:hypothetical protein Peur_000709 [Populus x canadensis]
MLLLLFAALGGRIRLLCCSCLLLLTVLSPHSRLQQEIMMGRESCFYESVVAARYSAEAEVAEACNAVMLILVLLLQRCC